MYIKPHLSVDCVVFGFDSENLKILLIDRELSKKEKDYKLPGSLIKKNEELDTASERVLLELTGLKDIFLKQLYAFGNLDRVKNPIDLKWFNETYNTKVERVVTIAYYSLIRIDQSNLKINKNTSAKWYNIDEVKKLAFDHNKILNNGLDVLRNEIKNGTVIFELLPEKFTIRQLQNLYEISLGQKLDNRNFRKKIEKLDYLLPLKEKEQGVAHKPAQLFKFNRKMKSKFRYNKEFVFG